MPGSVEDRLAELGVELPRAPAPASNYLPFMRDGNTLYISGQLPLGADGVSCRGKLGSGVSLEEGRAAARLCAMNVLAQARAALDGDLDRIVQFIRITGFVASAPDFSEQRLVINGASDFLVEVLGPRGRHARAAVGMAALPLDAAVEVDAIIAVA